MEIHFRLRDAQQEELILRILSRVYVKIGIRVRRDVGRRDQKLFLRVKCSIQEFPVEPAPEGTGLPCDALVFLVVTEAIQDIAADDQDPVPIPGQDLPLYGLRPGFRFVVLLIAAQGEILALLGIPDLLPLDLHAPFPALFVRQLRQQGVSAICVPRLQKGVRPLIDAAGDDLIFPQLRQHPVSLIVFSDR